MPSSITVVPSAALIPIEEDGVSGRPHIALPLQNALNDNSLPPSSASSSNPPLVHFALPSPSYLLQPTPQDSSSSSTLPTPPPASDDLNAALTTTLPHSAPSSVPSTPAPSEMFFFDSSPEHVEIVIPTDNIVLRGVGQDVEPTVFAGQVVLRLPEATNIKEINLNFSGKSRLLSADSRAPAFRQPITTHTFFSHDWSLLEGAKGHRHTLKAGTHSFPFQLNIDDTFPSSISVGSTSSISYKLRATIVRSSFSSNWVAQRPVTIARGFSPEALEYNQTLEIENTWPGKIMYSVMIPHKAFAAGDDIPVSLKFTPLVKGVAVMNIETSIKQYLSIRAKGALPFQDARIVAKTTHFIRNGLPVEARAGRRTSPTLWDVSTGCARTTAIMTPAMQVEPDHIPPLAMQPRDRSISSSSGGGSGSSSGRGSSERLAEEAVEDDLERGDNELDTCIKFRIPAWTTPSNMSEPIVINYKLKWSITLSNLDGHTSELRCALPVHILSHTLLDEARAASMQTRAILFGSEEDGEVEPTQTILPSYASHIQDRIANALDAVAPTRLAPNPLHNLDGGATAPGEETPAELVDTGLLLSLGQASAVPFLRNVAAGGGAGTPPLSRSVETTPPDSRRSSFRTGGRSATGGAGGSSRTSSRATSPEPPEPADQSPSTSAGIGSSKSFFSLKPLTNLANKIASANSRSLSQIHHPVTGTGLGGSSSASSSNSSSNHVSPKLLSRALAGGLSRSRPASSSNLLAEFSAAAASTPPPNQLEILSDLLSRVPNYERASQGFLGGGVPPLDTYAGLPTYNEVESSIVRVRSDGALLQQQAGQATGGVYSEHSSTSSSLGDIRSMNNATPRPQMPGRALTSNGNEARRRQASFTLDP